MQKPIGGPIATSCADLKQLGHSKSGFHTVKSPSNAKLMSVYCDYTKEVGAKGLIDYFSSNLMKFKMVANSGGTRS